MLDVLTFNPNIFFIACFTLIDFEFGNICTLVNSIVDDRNVDMLIKSISQH